MSLEASSVCVVDGSGKIVREAKVASESDVLVLFFRELNSAVTRIGIEACPLSRWLHARLTAAGFAVVLLEVHHVKAAISAMAVAKRRGLGRATVALARKLAIVMHRMWINGTDFRFGKQEAATA